jgi:glycosyltransferase involved in cell wall biosynthesis
MPMRAPSRRNRLTACLIVKNEARCLARCLKSMIGLADETIVVDTGSTDRTVAIAKDYGARVESFAWCDDFSAARNHALSFATGEWVLSVDADEWIADEGTRRFLRGVVDAGRAGGFIAVHVGESRESITNIRLFPREGAYWEYRVHEQIVLPGLNGRGVLDRRFRLHHDGYDRPVAKPGEKNLRNHPLLERMRAESEPGSRPFRHARIYLARDLKTPFDAEAIRELEAAVLDAIDFDPYNHQLLTGKLYGYWVGTGDFEALDAFNERAIAQGASGPLISFSRAVHLLNEDRKDEAREELARAEAAHDMVDMRRHFAPMFRSLAEQLG